jgi:A/G-specific adenine glycosylase
MNQEAGSNGFGKRLLAWYDAHARDLPWRESRDPYRVWLSEIMLQQTRVAAVIAHYHEFLRRFPTVEKLAAAREASVLAAWSGLGYYRRARMLHATAKVVVRELGGKFPSMAVELRSLPGVGRYTAAAIASIAFGERAAVVDGNVERVLQRLSGRRLAGEDFWRAAQEMLDRERPGDFNQAMMELGATVCTPRGPECLTCPVVELCATRGVGESAAKAVPQRKREVHYALDVRDGTVFLVRRDQDARLMAGMWELPEIETSASGAKAPLNEAGEIAALKALRHPKAKRIAELKASRHPKAKRVTESRRGDSSNLGVAPQRESFTPGMVEAGIVEGGVVQVGVVQARAGNTPQACLTLRHSITVTDYAVHVWRASAPPRVRGERVAVDRLARVALTGLARKILRKAGIIVPIRKAASVI